MSTPQTGGPKPSRRTLVKGAAWSVPVVAVAGAAPALAASPGCIEVAFTGSSCKCPGAGNDWSYYLGFCFTNVCADPNSDPVTLTVTNLTNNAGKAFSPSVTSPATLELQPGQKLCTGTSFHTSSSSAGKIRVYYSLDGVPQGYAELPAPPNCAAGTCPDSQSASAETSSHSISEETSEQADSNARSAKEGTVEVPNVVGQNLMAASLTLGKAGLTMSPDAAAGTILTQDPAAGESVTSGTVVKVTTQASEAVETAPEPAEVSAPAPEDSSADE